VLDASVKRILAQVADDALVLDVGGWGRPLARADWVIDLLPYETRGLYGMDGEAGSERFSDRTWVTRDICAREPWPFADDQFDYVVCSHTLEDVRDPVAVCDELVRVARAGYIEVPSRLWEQTYGAEGEWVGWAHHHWLCDVDQAAGRIDFVFKHGLVNGAHNQFPKRFLATLTPERRVQQLWWEGRFDYGERIFTDGPALDAYLSDIVIRHRHEIPRAPRLRRLRGAASRLRRLLS
jgi:hypothetical protein